MLTKLRRKFILAAVCSVFAVLAVILGIINAVNYSGVVREADETIAVLRAGDGSFGSPPGHGMSPEAPFSTRYFTVTLASDGTVLATDTERIAAVTKEEAASYATALFLKGRTRGFYANYRFGTATVRTDETMYLFVDCSAALGNFYTFLYTSLIVGLAGVAVVFVLIFVLSGRIMRPVAESHLKQRQFITDAGHELKTPLTIIGANAEILELQSGENDSTREIKTQVARLASLTEKLVFLAKLDETAKLSSFSFCLSDAVSETAQSFLAVAKSRGIALKTEIRSGIFYTGNEEMLRRLVSLLLDNALKYSDGDVISLSLHAEGAKRVLRIKNGASYLADGKYDRLFERFVRLDPARNSDTGGHGIGLSVVHAIAAAHGGKATAECRAGEITFTVIL